MREKLHSSGHSSPDTTRSDPLFLYVFLWSNPSPVRFFYIYIVVYLLPLPFPLPLPCRDVLRRLSLSPASTKRDLRRSVSSEDLLAGLRIGVSETSNRCII